jgi:hypothetical protein
MMKNRSGQRQASRQTARKIPFAEWIRGSDARLWAALAFMSIVFLTGGGSRSDIASLPLLRSLAVLFGAYALWSMPAGRAIVLRAPLAWLALLALWMVVQLIPLPASAWSTLPGRDAIYRIDGILGQADIWRPISLTPSMTWNSLMSLVVPAAALLLFAGVEPEHRKRLLTALMIIGVASAALSLLQVWMKSDLLYFYRITNRGEMVGFFSNRNHHAIFLACMLVLAGLAMRGALNERAVRPAYMVGLAAGSALMIIVILGIGSRGGLLIGLIALAVYAAFVWPVLLAAKPKTPGRPVGLIKTPRARVLVLVVLPLVLLAMLALLFFASDQSNAINRSVGGSYSEELRGQTLPVLIGLMQQHWLVGTGFGSFAGVYRMVEPDSLLQPEYFNHAHNDWGQIVIEGGLPMILLVFAALFWVAGRLFVIWRNYRSVHGTAFPTLPAAAAAIIALIALVSVGDYPLRTPSLMLLLSLVVVLLARAPSQPQP